jgi:hypothetical protein
VELAATFGGKLNILNENMIFSKLKILNYRAKYKKPIMAIF